MEEMFAKEGLKWINTYYRDKDRNCIVIKIHKTTTEESYEILIDEEDVDIVKQGIWRVINPRKNSHLKDTYNIQWTKRINGKKINYEIYQLILNTKGKSVVIDHINMNRFDNRKANLRICTPQINRVNQEAKGCYYEKQTGKYLARIKVNGKEINIGRYNTEREAEEIYLKCNILLGYDKISFTIKEKIKERNIALSEEDLENKYIKKVYNLLNDIEEFSIEKAL